MQRSCRQCQATFDITPADLAFYDKVSPVFAGKKEPIPPPTLCPNCRMQRRFAYRNERFLYRRTCDLTKKNVISFYRSDSPFKVYDRDAWWSDQWDAMEYGRPFDPSRSFFEQTATLRQAVPRLAMVITNDEGSAYSAYCVETKHCYMCSSCVVNEDSYYCYQANASKSCVDCNNVTQCEFCYECLHCFGLYSSASCKDCENGSGLLHCEDCRGCTDCIGCKNLVNRKHWILNRQASEDEVKAMKMRLRFFHGQQEFSRRFHDLAVSLPTRAAHLVQCENCTGDHLHGCKNSFDCFDAINLEDCRFLCPIPGLGTKDCQDCHYSPGSELTYDSMSGMRCQRARFVLHSWDNEDITYCDECFSSKHLFGCIGLRHKEYCVFNKQYTKEEYETLVSTIIEHMRKVGEWGEFFPVKDSLFGYNETIAQNEFPLTKEEAQERGWRWEEDRGEVPKVEKVIPAEKLPDGIEDVPDDLVQWAVACEATGRPFKIVKQELEFYRNVGIPLPRLHPEERYRQRIVRRNPRKLWQRNCAKCGKGIETTYQPSRPEIVYCEDCYLKEVY